MVEVELQLLLRGEPCPLPPNKFLLVLLFLFLGWVVMMDLVLAILVMVSDRWGRFPRYLIPNTTKDKQNDQIICT
jgi:hypothetical protein